MLNHTYYTTTEHPRVRGENPATWWKSGAPRGTSPRTRGKRPGGKIELLPYRNIPAYAGKTIRQRKEVAQCREHPRVRGENRVVPIAVKAPCGTSPRTRGKQPLRTPPHHQTRNIPAYAGKTVTLVFVEQCFEEHPRVRGENPRKLLIDAV